MGIRTHTHTSNVLYYACILLSGGASRRWRRFTGSGTFWSWNVHVGFFRCASVTLPIWLSYTPSTTTYTLESFVKLTLLILSPGHFYKHASAFIRNECNVLLHVSLYFISCVLMIACVLMLYCMCPYARLHVSLYLVACVHMQSSIRTHVIKHKDTRNHENTRNKV